MLVTSTTSIGFEITDESYYLIWQEYPELFHVGSSAFGYILNPVFELLQGDFVLLRALSILVFVGLSFWLFRDILLSFGLGFLGERLNFWVYSISISASVFMFYSTYILTPNYNSLNLQALMLFGILMVRLINNVPSYRTLSALILGADLVLIGINKPTTGLVALSITAVVIAVLKLSKESEIKIISVTIGALFSVLLFIVWMQSLGSSVVDFYYQGSELQQIFDPRYSFSNLLRSDFEFKWGELLPFAFLFTLSLAASSQYSRVTTKVFFTIALILDVVYLSVFFIESKGNLSQTPVFLYALVGVLLYVCFSSFIGKNRLPDLKSFGVALLFLLLPWAYVVGTNNNYVVAEIHASVFWVAACLVLLLGLGSKTQLSQNEKLSIFSLLVIIVVSTTLIYSFLHPYRQPQTDLGNLTTVEIGTRKIQVKVPKVFSTYLDDLQSVSKIADFKAGTPVIDLTGESPGTVFLLGGVSVYQPWFIGGYPGSNEYAKRLLTGTSCSDLKNSWILLSKDNSRHFDSSILATVNLSLEKDFRLISEFSLPDGYGSSPLGYKQYLYQPIQSQKFDLDNCIHN